MKYTWPLIDAKNELEKAYIFYKTLDSKDKYNSLPTKWLRDTLQQLDMLIDVISK